MPYRKQLWLANATFGNHKRSKLNSSGSSRTVSSFPEALLNNWKVIFSQPAIRVKYGHQTLINVGRLGKLAPRAAIQH